MHQIGDGAFANCEMRNDLSLGLAVAEFGLHGLLSFESGIILKEINCLIALSQIESHEIPQLREWEYLFPHQGGDSSQSYLKMVCYFEFRAPTGGRLVLTICVDFHVLTDLAFGFLLFNTGDGVELRSYTEEYSGSSISLTIRKALPSLWTAGSFRGGRELVQRATPKG